MRNRTFQSVLGLAALTLVLTLSLTGGSQRQAGANPPSLDTVELSMLALAQTEPQAGRLVAPRGSEGSDEPTSARRSRGEPSQLTPMMIERCLEVARDIDADLGRELTQKRTKSPEDFAHFMSDDHVGRRLWAMAQLKQRDPDLYRHKISEVAQSLQINRVAARLYEARQGTDQGKINALTEQLKNLLQIEFALSLKARCEYLARIEEQAQALREEIDKDASNFQKIIDDRMKRLLEHPPQPDAAAVLPATKHGPSTAQPPLGSTR